MRFLLIAALLLFMGIKSAPVQAGGDYHRAKGFSADYVVKTRSGRCYRGKFRTTCNPQLSQYFFPPYQFRAVRCSYGDYRKFRKKDYRTYRCWKRKPAYRKRNRHIW